MLTYDRLIERLSYDSSTGIFQWKNHLRKVGSIDVYGYLIIKIDGKSYKSHRLAWLYMTSEWPKDTIDHKNGIKNDNRWDNLREATNSENCMNRCRNETSLSGHKNITVGYYKGEPYRYILQLNSLNKRIVCKSFSYSAEGLKQACEYRDSIKPILHGKFLYKQ